MYVLIYILKMIATKNLANMHHFTNGNPYQYSCLEKSHGQRSLAGYSPSGGKNSDTTEWLHFHFQKLAQLVKQLYSSKNNFF